MAEGRVANADGIEAAQARVCEVRAIMQLVVENLERIPAASSATDAVHVANEMLDGVYEQLESLLEPEARHEVMPFRRRSATREPAP
jgi:hypothetical protein